MSLLTYSDLKSAITSWCYGRADIAAVADDFIALTEGAINYGARDPATGNMVQLRTRSMETTTSLTPDANGQATIPTDYLEFRQVTSTDTPRRELKLIAPSMAEEKYGFRESDLPNNFTIIGTKIQVLPVSTTPISLVYYAKIPVLSDSNTTNWLLTAKPNIYLFGCMHNACIWMADERAQSYLGMFINEIYACNESDTAGRWSRAFSMNSGQKP